MSGLAAVRRHVLTLTEGAVATSMMLGTTFDKAHGHFLHRRRGLIEVFHARTAVVAATSVQADALSTVAVLMDPDQLVVLRDSGVQLYL